MRAWLAAILILTPALLAQRAQLGVKGRQQERVRPRKLEPIRKLPRRGPPGVERIYGPSPLEQYLEKQRAAQPPPLPVPADRTRRLVRRTPAPAAAPALGPAEKYAYFPLPRKAEGEPGFIATLPPDFAVPSPPAEDPSIPNRWRIGLPHWRRYENTKLDAIYTRSRWWDPFNLNTLKGDYPLFGKRHFLNFTGSSDTLVDTRRIPVPSVASAARPGDFGFFGRGEQMLLRQSFRLSFDLFGGNAGFKPVDYELRITPEFNINYAVVRENALTRIDVREGRRRTDTNIGMQELFLEKRLFTHSTAAFRPGKDVDDRGSAYFDFTSLRFGIQRFTSDFRGFVYSDEQPGARLFGTIKNNVFQYNLAFFRMLEKDTNSGLNRWRQRNQSVYAANLYWNDFLTLGYNFNFSLLYNNDQPTFHIDKNGFLVRPAPIGLPAPHKIRAGYAGTSSDGHIGRYNFAHAFYYAFGRDNNHGIPAMKQAQHIRAFLAAAELSYERDWAFFRTSFFMSTGDNDVNDGVAKGFDGIVPNQQFAGGGFLGNPALADRGLINNVFEGGGTNFLNRQFIPLTGTGVTLFGLNSLMPTMRAGLFQGQANFINPGVMLANVGMDAKLTPKLRSTINVNYLRFHRTEVLEAVLFQSGIRHGIGLDSGFGLQYRPKLSENIVVTGGFGLLFPHAGFKDIYTGRTQLSGFINVRVLF
ncbi:MAG: hypothetical protein FJW20_16170 [Acidimicrobiia bacterium]|nr:hypothetical protein [Acidimicrobiia bacterium]